MARCPICGKENVFGEQLTHSDFLLSLVCYECRDCGAFRMSDEASRICAQLDDEAICRLLDRIEGSNRLRRIPVINTCFLSSLLVAQPAVAACAS